MNTNSYILEMLNVSKSFSSVKALDNVSLKVLPGTVHALMGENGAGKSTLMKCLFGIYAMDSGEIIFNDSKIRFSSARNAIENGISMIHQELYPQIHLSVMENIWVGRLPVKFGIVDYTTMYDNTVKLLQGLDIDLDPKTKVGSLSVSQMQCIEIVRAVSFESKIIIMDEPTSSLTENEVENLFRIINKLRVQGVTFIYISHRIDEILRIADYVSIMRDGIMVGTWKSSGLTNDFIISSMVGREMNQLFPKRKNRPGDIVLEIENYTSPMPKCFKNISLNVREGEILGIGGLVGAQRTELIEAIFGIRQSTGIMRINGKQVDIKSPIDAKRHKIALLTEDRRRSGVFSLLSVAENITIANYHRYENQFRALNHKRIILDAEKGIKRLNIKTPSSKFIIRNLSGGNQQKVLFARWLLTEPEILLLDEPTRGIDVGAKYEIYCIIASLAEQGKSIIMITSEMNELISMSDRVAVMCEGRLVGELTGEDITETRIMYLASKYSTKSDSSQNSAEIVQYGEMIQ